MSDEKVTVSASGLVSVTFTFEPEVMVLVEDLAAANGTGLSAAAGRLIKTGAKRLAALSKYAAKGRRAGEPPA